MSLLLFLTVASNCYAICQALELPRQCCWGCYQSFARELAVTKQSFSILATDDWEESHSSEYWSSIHLETYTETFLLVPCCKNGQLMQVVWCYLVIMVQFFELWLDSFSLSWVSSICWNKMSQMWQSVLCIVEFMMWGRLDKWVILFIVDDLKQITKILT